MSCYNGEKERVYYSKDEIMADPTLTDEERSYIMTKSKTTVQVDATHQKTVWVRSNDQNNNRYRGNRNQSGNRNNSQYNSNNQYNNYR